MRPRRLCTNTVILLLHTPRLYASRPWPKSLYLATSVMCDCLKGETSHYWGIIFRSGRVRTDEEENEREERRTPFLTHFSSVQFKTVYMRTERPIGAPPRLSEVSPTLPLKRFQCSSDCRWLSVLLSREIV